jgi:protein gp37
LAYIEWFTPLKTPDATDGYYHISRSTRQHQPYAEIITADRIVRNAMLIPLKWGEDKTFFLNSHSDAHAFCTFKLGYRNALPR